MNGILQTPPFRNKMPCLVAIFPARTVWGPIQADRTEGFLRLETDGPGVRGTWTYECVVCHESVLTCSGPRRRAVMPDGVIVDTDTRGGPQGMACHPR